MVIEVVAWPSASKTHVINQDFPDKTLCGLWIPSTVVRYATTPERAPEDDDMPTCLRCANAVMHS